MIRNTLRRPHALALALILTALPALAAPRGAHPAGAKPAASASLWSVLLEKTREILGAAPAPPNGGAQPQNDAGPTMDPLGR
jgi:hypothetical protein